MRPVRKVPPNAKSLTIHGQKNSYCSGWVHFFVFPESRMPGNLNGFVTKKVSFDEGFERLGDIYQSCENDFPHTDQTPPSLEKTVAFPTSRKAFDS